MKKYGNIISLLALPVILAASFTSCNSGDSDTWEDYAQWRKINQEWMNEQADLLNEDGTPVYTRVVPSWNENAYVLMRWHNDTTLTRENLRPLYTSTVDVKYIGRFYNDEPFDSSYVNVEFGDSIFRTRCSAVIEGWTIALERTHVGDSVEVLIPYQQGYGATPMGTAGTASFIKPYSALKFDIKLVDIPGEYIRP